ncbi:hypothetical protein ONS95_001342 [Cadophora gregata]|uniref:uncharacterized protein n=1 Tax=Cadophora gregata TaxID=51156 RepID=UPI0026DD88B0|nr:uncharacterized protein ONS95_001342 [Cadophora gregata]KAK0101844.1 hypothetical protein ONS96_005822 [Cadophora gregata f. sp. sojae]KAK0129420.1 hypothetical protein ONS95_001342 [Cadophora gregata]
MLLRYFPLLSLLFLSSTKASRDCAEGYSLCSPPGATSTTTPQILTPEFQTLFINIIQSSLPSNNNKRTNHDISSSSQPSSSSPSLCCNVLLSCLLMSTTHIPFCYDRFTTNYFLPDGSYGTVATGTYTSPNNNSTANLQTGEYTLSNGQTGNIYSYSYPYSSEEEDEDGSSKPNLATLPPLPTPFTGTGVGSAIPASSLGREITIMYVTTIPGATRDGSTVLPWSTFSLVRETILLPTVVEGSTIAVTEIETRTVLVVVQGSTVAGTTFAETVRTVTTATTTAAGDATVLGTPSVPASGMGKKSQAGGSRRGAGVVIRKWILVFGMLMV